jgi:hypothetical protein
MPLLVFISTILLIPSSDPAVIFLLYPEIVPPTYPVYAHRCLPLEGLIQHI